MIIYLDASPAFLLDRIKKRGRDFEKNISEIYLKNIEQGYKSFFIKKQTIKVLFYDISEKDFINNDIDLNHLLETVYNF